MDQFLLFGDSLTQQSFSQDHGFGLGAALSNAYVRRLDVVNRGFSGFNTIQALHVIDKVIPLPSTARLRFLTIWFGANDSRLPHTPGTPQHVALTEYSAALRKLITHPLIAAHDDVRIILLTPPPVEESLQEAWDRSKFNDMPGLRRTATANAEYAKAARDIAADLNIACLDVWTLMITHAGYNSQNSTIEDKLPGSKELGTNKVLADLLSDGLHFTPAGYRLVYNELIALIARTWPDQTPEQLQFAVPAWDDPKAWQGVYPGTRSVA